MLKKILGVVLKIRYDVESIAQRQNELEKSITDHFGQIKDGSLINNFETNEDDDFEFYVPITNEDSLNDFEQKLIMSKSFKLNAVCHIHTFF